MNIKNMKLILGQILILLYFYNISIYLFIEYAELKGLTTSYPFQFKYCFREIRYTFI